MLELSSDSGILVFGGPYSNLRALQALRIAADRHGIPADHVICTGDVVAYCAEPEETTRLVRDWEIRIVAGNCEVQLAEGADDCGCGFAQGSACDVLARRWYAYASRLISQESRAWMAGLQRSLSFRYAGRRFLTIHGGVTNISRFLFASEPTRLAEELAAADCDIVLAGHAGLPFIRVLSGGVWFNPGVIGMPANDGTPDVWYGLVRARAGAVQMSTHRLAYDHQGAADALDRAGHVPDYAEALRTGVWPSLDVLPPEERAATGAALRPTSLTLP